MTARDEYANLAGRDMPDRATTVECNAALDEIDRLRSAIVKWKRETSNDCSLLDAGYALYCLVPDDEWGAA